MQEESECNINVIVLLLAIVPSVRYWQINFAQAFASRSFI